MNIIIKKKLRIINLNYYLQRINETKIHLLNTGDWTTNLNFKCAKLIYAKY